MSKIPLQTSSSGSCVLTRNDFINSFQQVPITNITNIEDFESIIQNAVNVLQTSEDWKKRNDNLKLIRSAIIHGSGIIDNNLMISKISLLNEALVKSIKDLRSQVMREAAITCSCIVYIFQNSACNLAQQLIEPTLTQTAVSKKVISSSAAVLSTFIIEFVHHKKIFKLIESFANSKDKNIRKQVARLIEIVISKWEKNIRETIILQVCHCIKLFLDDADGDVRSIGRETFNKLQELHPKDAENLFQSLDIKRQRIIRGINLTPNRVSCRKSVSSLSKTATKFTSARSFSELGSLNQHSTMNNLKLEQIRRTRRTIPTGVLQRSCISKNTNAVKILPQMPDRSSNLLRSFQKIPNVRQRDIIPRKEHSITEAKLLCDSSSVQERMYATLMILSILKFKQLDECEIEQVGDLINKLITFSTNTTLLEVYTLYIQKYHGHLEEWVSSSIYRLLMKKCAEIQESMKTKICNVIDLIANTFPAESLIISIGRIITNQSQCSLPKFRPVILEYLCAVLANVHKPYSIKTDLKPIIIRILHWISDPDRCTIIWKNAENIVQRLHEINPNKFNELINDEELKEHSEVIEKLCKETNILVSLHKNNELEQSIISKIGKISKIRDISDQYKQLEKLYGYELIAEKSLKILMIDLIKLIIRSKNEKNMKLALKIIVKLCKKRREEVSRLTEVLMRMLIKIAKTSSANLQIELCFSVLSRQLLLENLIKFVDLILKEEEIETALKIILVVIQRKDVEAAFDNLVKTVQKFMESGSADIRKLAVCCLAEMINRYGMERMMDYFQDLPVNKKKLVDFYVIKKSSNA